MSARVVEKVNEQKLKSSKQSTFTLCATTNVSPLQREHTLDPFAYEMDDFGLESDKRRPFPDLFLTFFLFKGLGRRQRSNPNSP